LLSELDAILKNDKKPNIFIIDDARFWINEKFKPDDWKEVSLDNILNIFKIHNVNIKDHYLTFDRYIIFSDF
jgi:sulfur relay (sulfurtransferase) DsrF/TusC family protein